MEVVNFSHAPGLTLRVKPSRLVVSRTSTASAVATSTQAPPVSCPALMTLRDWLEKLEQGKLRDELLTHNYVIIRPLSLAKPPSAESLADITAAIGVLNHHALIITTGDWHLQQRPEIWSWLWPSPTSPGRLHILCDHFAG